MYGELLIIVPCIAVVLIIFGWWRNNQKLLTQMLKIEKTKFEGGRVVYKGLCGHIVEHPIRMRSFAEKGHNSKLLICPRCYEEGKETIVMESWKQTKEGEGGDKPWIWK